MLIVLYLLLMLPVGRSTDDQNFVTTTVRVGENVTLTCSRNTSRGVSTFFWIRLVAGNLPEILGKTFSHAFKDDNVISRIKTKQEPGTFVLYITKMEQRDSAFYYCLKFGKYNVTFLKGVFLRIEGPEPDVTAVIQHFNTSDPVRPGDSVTLQCSVVSDSEKKTCPEQQHSVFWFHSGSKEPHPSLIYVQTNSGGECERSPEAPSSQSCVYSFFKDNVSSSDAGTYYCALAACGTMVFGNGTNLDIEVDSQKDNTVLFLLCVSLAISLIVIVLLVGAIWKKTCECCKASVALQPNAETVSGNQQNQQRNEESLVYSIPVFTKRNADKAGRRNATAKKDTVYSEVRAFGRKQF